MAVNCKPLMQRVASSVPVPVYHMQPGFLLMSSPIDPNESQLQLDLVYNGKAVNVAMKLQISCSETGE